ncbi:MAG: N-acetylmuramoyl-L-alanine amidase [Ruminococcaceae bacterium]|nr:N-acetylmuramoyl-L-alanine amidase [Oscillospiraceae bacterium]
MKSTKIFFYLFLVLLVFFLSSLGIFYFFNYKNQKPAPPQNESQIKTPQITYPTVIIDAGHGGEDGGAIGKNGAYEKDINLEIAKKLKSKLDALGIPCVLTRSTDILLYDRNTDYEGKKKKLDLLARKEFAEKYDNAIFISIHQNSYPKEQYSGFQVYYSPNNDTSVLLANLLEKAASKTLTDTRCRPSKVGTSSIYLLDKLQCPAILVECGFISNTHECIRLCNEEYQNRLCEAIVEGIIKFLK